MDKEAARKKKLISATHDIDKVHQFLASITKPDSVTPFITVINEKKLLSTFNSYQEAKDLQKELT